MLRLYKEDVHSLEDVIFVHDAKAHEILGKDYAAWTRGRQMLPSTNEAMAIFKLDLWENFVNTERSIRTIKVLWFSGN